MGGGLSVVGTKVETHKSEFRNTTVPLGVAVELTTFATLVVSSLVADSSASMSKSSSSSRRQRSTWNGREA
jgi:hypothetical protein